MNTLQKFVFLKLDVEGYEFELLPHLFSSICHSIDALGIEWHHGMVPNLRAEELPDEWEKRLSACGVALKPWP